MAGNGHRPHAATYFIRGSGTTGSKKRPTSLKDEGSGGKLAGSGPSSTPPYHAAPSMAGWQPAADWQSAIVGKIAPREPAVPAIFAGPSSVRLLRGSGVLQGSGET